MAAYIQPRFFPGQIVYHHRAHYRGVVVDVDPQFTHPRHSIETDEAEPTEAEKLAPWYYLLVDGTERLSYAAEHYLEADRLGNTPIDHPALEELFSHLRDGRYHFRHWHN